MSGRVTYNFGESSGTGWPARLLAVILCLMQPALQQQLVVVCINIRPCEYAQGNSQRQAQITENATLAKSRSRVVDCYISLYMCMVWGGPILSAKPQTHLAQAAHTHLCVLLLQLLLHLCCHIHELNLLTAQTRTCSMQRISAPVRRVHCEAMQQQADKRCM